MLGFSSSADAEAWPENDMLGAAIVDSASDCEAGHLLGIQEERCVDLIAMDAPRSPSA